jgi:predicted nucleic acid-binding protein
LEQGGGQTIQEKIGGDPAKLENQLIVLDTDVIIDFFRNISPGADVVSKLVSQEIAALTSVSVFELYAGIKGKRRLVQIETFIQHLVILPLDAIESVIAGKIYTQLKSKGQLIGTEDILIASICLTNELPLYTNNVAHFSRIDDIQLLTTKEILEQKDV